MSVERIYPSDWQAELVGQTMKHIRPRDRKSDHPIVDIEFRSGRRYKLVAEENARLTAALINTLRWIQPISEIQLVWPKDGTLETTVFARHYELFTIRGETFALGGVPFYLIHLADLDE